MSTDVYPVVAGYQFWGVIPREPDGVQTAQMWEAERLQDGTPVAIKIGGSPGEAALLSTLDHPRIAPALDSGTTADGAPFLVLPLYAHVLSDFMRWPTTTDGVRPIVAPILEGLDYLHRAGFAHGDVKLGNVCLSEAGPVLIDFESSVSLAAPVPLVDMDRMWTLWTSPPEVLSCAVSTPNVLTDLYSAAALAYHLLCWEPVAPRGHDIPALLAAHSLKRKPRLPERATRWQAWIDKALEPDPQDRFQDAGEMLTELPA